MSYNKFVFNVVLACSFFSINAENRYQQSLKAGAQKAGRVAKVGAYGALTGVTGAAAVALLGIDCFCGYVLYEGIKEKGFERYSVKLETIARKYPIFAAGTATFAVTSPAFVYGLGRAVLYCARKTKEAAGELKAA